MMQSVVNGMASGSIIAILAIGFALVSRSGFSFHFAHGAIFTITAEVFQSLLNSWNFPITGAVSISLVVAVLLGILIDCFIYNPLREKTASVTILLVASLAVYSLAESLASILFGSASKIIRLESLRKVFHFWGGRITITQLVSIMSLFPVIILTSLWFTKSRSGKCIRALGENSDLALAIGIPALNVRWQAMGIGSLFAGLSAILYACDTAVFPTMGLQPLLIALTAVVISRSTILGSALLATGIGLLRHLSAIWIPIIWQDSMVFVVLTCYLLLYPAQTLKYTKV